MKVRDQLDSIAWIVEAMEPIGFHGGAELEAWRARTHRAYLALVDSMAPGHGDPLPPDIPPSVRPGVWPDVAAGGIPGMTVRHQLAVLRVIAAQTRTDRVFPHSPADVATWTARVQAAYDALDHGPAMTVPDSARTLPPQPPPGSGSKRSKAAARGTKGHAKTDAASKAAPRKAAAPAKARPKKPASKRAGKGRS